MGDAKQRKKIYRRSNAYIHHPEGREGTLKLGNSYFPGANDNWCVWKIPDSSISSQHSPVLADINKNQTPTAKIKKTALSAPAQSLCHALTPESRDGSSHQSLRRWGRRETAPGIRRLRIEMEHTWLSINNNEFRSQSWSQNLLIHRTKRKKELLIAWSQRTFIKPTNQRSFTS